MLAKGKTNFISVVIITKNEEKNVGACIQSVLPVAAEIVVVDSFSTDKTEEICRSFGVRFLQRDWEGYARTKNWANSQAENDWILSMDADEALSPELLGNIQALLEQGLTPDTAYSFNRLTNYCGQWIRHGGWYPDVKVRLFDRRQARWTGDYVHERLELDSGVVIRHLEGDLLHYTFRTIDEHVAQVNRYSTLAAEEKHARGKQSSVGKLLFSPLFSFIQMYFFKLGMLDGRNGFVIAVISAYARFLRYAKLWQRRKG